MKNIKNESSASDKEDQLGFSNENSESSDLPQKKGPLSFLSGALTSGTFAYISYIISQNLVVYFSRHTPDYSSAIAQSIASGFKTLIIGTSFLATFSFAFIGLGLIIVFIKSLFDAKNQ